MARILLAEDDVELCGTLQMVLSGQKHSVTAVLNGLEALEQCRYGQFDLIILDGYLPDMHGIEICRAFRGDGGTAPVLMLTGRVDATAVSEAKAAGATAYLKKPFGIKELIDSVNSLLVQLGSTANVDA
ncbi:MAG: response regulator [Candidatus Obscuribacterales bacterium]|nr:response regulator [Candidatus Obscuribacterales bacterium]